LNHPAKASYPSHWIIKSAVKKGIPIVMGSDSHTPGTLGQYFDQAHDLFR
ncbi:MAG: histidinol-phosphatase, partial [Desulfobacteraceae bacterium]|nr:histidinol-phosphatase [Desulfobacteraceae bacterium]